MTLPTRNERLERLAEIELTGERAWDDNGRVRIAISSETPVERWFGMEVLDHGRSSVDLNFAKRGAPVLVNHDPADQVGVLEDVTLEEDRILRGWVRFGQSARAQEIKQDVADGIRKFISVGYNILRMRKEAAAEGQPDTYRATRWRVLEASLVGVPADMNDRVGVGRAEGGTDALVELELPDQPADEATEERMAEDLTPPSAPAPAPAVTVDATGEQREIARLARNHKLTDRLPEWIERGASLNDVRKEILDMQKEQLVPAQPAAADVWDDLTKKEQQRYSVARALRAQFDPKVDAGFEREVSEAIEKSGQARQQSGSLLIPFAGVATRSLASNTASVGGNIVFTQSMPLIELLRNRAVTAMVNARFLTGLTGGPIAMPRQITAGAEAWRAEAPGSDLSDTDSTYDQVTLSPKLVQRNTAFSRQLLVQASEDVEALIRADLAAVLALAVDSVAIYGGGSNQPTGILANSAVSTVTLGANGATVTLASLLGAEQTVALSNADQGSLAFVTNPKQRYQARQIQYFSGTNGVPLWATNGAGPMNGRVLDYPAYVSNQVPSNLTKGTSTTICSGWIFGNWEELLVAQWGNALEVVVDPYSKKKQALIEVTAFLMADANVRHGGSFAVIKDAL